MTDPPDIATMFSRAIWETRGRMLEEAVARSHYGLEAATEAFLIEESRQDMTWTVQDRWAGTWVVRCFVSPPEFTDKARECKMTISTEWNPAWCPS